MARISKLRHWHRQIINYRLSHPDAKGKEVAAYFGVTEPWLSTVVNSSAFKEEEAQREDQHFNNCSMSVIRRLEEVAGLAMDGLIEQMEMEKLPFDSLRATMTDALGAMGFSSKAPVGAIGTVNNAQNNFYNVSISPAELERAQQIMNVADGAVLNGAEFSNPTRDVYSGKSPVGVHQLTASKEVQEAE